MKKLLVILCVSTLVLASCASKPDKESVKDAFQKILIQELNPNEEEKKSVVAYTDCLFDEAYDDLSAKTLNKIVNAKSGADFAGLGGTKKDTEVLEEARQVCSGKLISQVE